MTTMLSGAALMNGAVLVIASNEKCPQPRTIEHLMALKFAGVDKIVVAQNKVDLLTREQAIENQKAIKKFLTDYGYGDSPIIPVSANFGTNIDLLIQAIEEHIPTKSYDPSLPLKMFVARSFDVNKPGTKIAELKGGIIGGSISQGEINLGDEIELYPGLNTKSTITKVTSLSTSNGPITKAFPGGLIAIGTTLDPSVAQGDRLRGTIVAKPGTLPTPTKTITVSLHLFDRMLTELEEKVVIKTTDPLVLTVGTNTAVGVVTQTDGKKATIVLKNELVVEKGEKIAVSKNINGQWRLVAYAEIN
jgi:translation initiation factor 2 subunit 3